MNFKSKTNQETQPSNDGDPTAFRVGLLLSHAGVIEALEYLIARFIDRAHLFHAIFKIGRTQLQEDVPMTLGQESSNFFKIPRPVSTAIRSLKVND